MDSAQGKTGIAGSKHESCRTASPDRREEVLTPSVTTGRFRATTEKRLWRDCRAELRGTKPWLRGLGRYYRALRLAGRVFSLSRRDTERPSNRLERCETCCRVLLVYRGGTTTTVCRHCEWSVMTEMKRQRGCKRPTERVLHTISILLLQHLRGGRGSQVPHPRHHLVQLEHALLRRQQPLRRCRLALCLVRLPRCTLAVRASIKRLENVSGYS